MAAAKVLRLVRQWVTGTVPTNKVIFAETYSTNPSHANHLVKLPQGTQQIVITATFPLNTSGVANLAVKKEEVTEISDEKLDESWGIVATATITSSVATFTVDVGDLLIGGSKSMSVVAVVMPTAKINVAVGTYSGQ